MPCRAAIEKLRTDNEALKEEMQLENKFSVRPTSSSAAATIDALRQQSDACTQQVLVPLYYANLSQGGLHASLPWRPPCMHPCCVTTHVAMISHCIRDAGFFAPDYSGACARGGPAAPRGAGAAAGERAAPQDGRHPRSAGL